MREVIPSLEGSVIGVLAVIGKWLICVGLSSQLLVLWFWRIVRQFLQRTFAEDAANLPQALAGSERMGFPNYVKTINVTLVPIICVSQSFGHVSRNDGILFCRPQSNLNRST